MTTLLSSLVITANTLSATGRMAPLTGYADSGTTCTLLLLPSSGPAAAAEAAAVADRLKLAAASTQPATADSLGSGVLTAAVSSVLQQVAHGL